MTKPLPLLLAVLALAASAAPAPALARAPEAMPAAMTTAIPTAPALSAPLPEAMTLFRHVTATGTTKPDGAALDARRGTRPGLDAASHRLDRLIRTAVCTGC